MSRMANLGLIFTSPGTAARNLREDPHWLTPFLIVLVVCFVTGFVTHQYQAEQQREFLERLNEERGAEIDIDAQLESTTTRRVVSGATAAAFILAFLVVIPALILNGLAKVAGGESGFRRMLALLSLGNLIVALGMLVRLPIVFAKGSIDVRTSAAMFAPSVDLQSPLGTFLNYFDVFSIWGLIAVCIGFSVLTALTIKKSAAIVIGLWLVGLALVVGSAVVRTRLMGMA